MQIMKHCFNGTLILLYYNMYRTCCSNILNKQHFCIIIMIKVMLIQNIRPFRVELQIWKHNCCLKHISKKAMCHF